MTNKEILAIAQKQSALELNCSIDDLNSTENKVVISTVPAGARAYYSDLPFFCNLVSYGSNIVASVDESISEFILGYMSHRTVEHCFETPAIHLLTKEFEKFGKTPFYMAEYFLPDTTKLMALPCDYEIKILRKHDLAVLYQNEWSNALCEKRKHLDIFAAAAFHNGKMIGMAGCSADCGSLWQIGVDVLPEYRKTGVASALTSRLALKIITLGKVPFYCAAWSNIASVRNAIKSGFLPAWVELTSINMPVL